MSLEEVAALSQQLEQNRQPKPSKAPFKILFVCTHNRCRSILSEAITNQIGAGLIEAQSAGSAPAKQVHPLTLQYLANCGYDITALHSKSWQMLTDGFTPDVVITVCDAAAGESCPLWLGNVPKFHWGLADPSKLAVQSTVSNVIQTNESQANKTKNHEQDIAMAFSRCIAEIESRVVQLIPIALLPPEQRIAALKTLIVAK